MMNSNCQICGIKPATIKFQNLVNGKINEQNLCVDCSSKMQVFNFSDPHSGQNFAIDPSQIIASLLKTVGGMQHTGGNTQRQQIPVRQCSCGLTSEDIRKNLKFGCAVCYDTFKDVVESFLAAHMPGTHSHVGKTITSDSGMSEIERLKHEIAAAVAREDYELAAELKKKVLGLGG
jgi:protein arginine kinase activator